MSYNAVSSIEESLPFPFPEGFGRLFLYGCLVTAALRGLEIQADIDCKGTVVGGIELMILNVGKSEVKVQLCIYHVILHATADLHAGIETVEITFFI